MAARQLTWWRQLNNGQGGSDYATINIKERRQRRARRLGGKWRRDGSTGGVSAAMVGVVVTRKTAMPTTTTTRRQRQRQRQQQRRWRGASGSTREWTWQLRSAKGRRRKANAVDAYVDVSVSRRLASGHRSDDGRGNVVTLASGRRNESGWR